MALFMWISMMMEAAAKKRYKKDSFAWYKRVMESNGEEGLENDSQSI